MIYKDYKRNHVVLHGRDKALESFLKQDYKGMKHKWKNGFSSNSEDALTWSCFELISSFPLKNKLNVLTEIWEDSYEGKIQFPAEKRELKEDQIEIYIGKQYQGSITHELTEVDASIELPSALIFFEAKLYSTVSLPEPPEKPYDQIARKIRIGLDNPIQDMIHKYDFYFIFLDIAPKGQLILRKSKKDVFTGNKGGFYDKWKSAWLFNYYKNGRNNSLKPLVSILKGITEKNPKEIARNMGWLTWTDLFKDLLRGML